MKGPREEIFLGDDACWPQLRTEKSSYIKMIQDAHEQFQSK